MTVLTIEQIKGEIGRRAAKQYNKAISLQECEALTSDMMTKIVALLNETPSLEQLDFSRSQLTDDLLPPLAALKHITFLDLSQNNITDPTSLADYARPGRELNLRANNMRSQHRDILCEMHEKGLKLDIRGNQFLDPEFEQVMNTVLPDAEGVSDDELLQPLQSGHDSQGASLVTQGFFSGWNVSPSAVLNKTSDFLTSLTKIGLTH